MPEPCPCESCLIRKGMAQAFDMHIWGDDCPYQCVAYEAWSHRAGEEDKHENYT